MVEMVNGGRLRIYLALSLLGTTLVSAQVYDSAAGPSILSRGTRVGGAGDAASSLNFSFGVDGVYDGTLSSISSTGQLTNGGDTQGLGGVIVRGTIRGVHQWKRSSLGLSYVGDYKDYSGKTLYNGTTQSLNLDFTQQYNKHLSTNYKLAAGTTNTALGGIPGLPGGASTNGLDTLDPNFLAVPTAELFNNRMDYVQGQAGFSYRFNTRLSFGVSGSGYGVRREAKGLGGMNGYGGSADISYRLSKRATISAVYSFNHLEYPGAFGASDYHSVGASYARMIGKGWEVTITGKLNRVESLGLARVDLDPLVAALLGQTSGVEAFYSLHYLPGFDGRVSKRWRTSSFSVTAARGISPGNGLLLTSQQTSLGASYDYTGVRHWSLSVSGGYQELGSLGRTAGKFQSGTFGFAVSRELYRTLHFTSHWNYRDQFISSSTFYHNGSIVSVGLAWSPKNVPLSIW